LLDRLVWDVISLVGSEVLAARRILGLTNEAASAPGRTPAVTLLDLRRSRGDIAVPFEANNPFDGWRLRGATAMTIVGGRLAYPDLVKFDREK
jgi:dihydroorotase-like cyclic amidohydrolase